MLSLRVVTCPACRGEGSFTEYIETYPYFEECQYCRETGKISPWRWFMGEVWFGWLYDKLLWRWYER